MKYYTASLFYRSEHTPSLPEKEELWEEKIILIKTDSKEAAEKIANSYGESDCCSYSTEAYGALKWIFVKVERVVEVEGDIGTTVLPVFSRYLSNDEARSILKPLE